MRDEDWDDPRWQNGVTAWRSPPAQPAGTRVRVKRGLDGAGRTGLGYTTVVVGQTIWVVVVWDGGEDPDLHKLAGLEVFVWWAGI